jgi:hypothetical protein
VRICKLEGDGKVWRTFTHHVERASLDVRLGAIARAFNMAHTAVYVDGRRAQI